MSPERERATAGALPLRGWRVAVTRAAEQAGELADGLRALGGEVLTYPLIAIAPPADPGPLDRALARLAEYDWLVLPSANAARAVLERADLPGAPALRIAAVGPATAATLAARSVTVALVPADHSAAGLLAAIGELRGAHVLLPQGDLAGPELAAGLLARGAAVDSVDAYRTLPGPGAAALAAALSAGAIDAVTFTSPSAVRALLDGMCAGGAPRADAAGLLARAALVAIGPTTAAALCAERLPVAAVAEPHSAAGIADALAALLARRSGVEQQE